MAQAAGANLGIDMNNEPYVHPEEGLVLGAHNNVVFAQNWNQERVVDAVSGGVDFDASALPMWHHIQKQKAELHPMHLKVVKTQFTGNCSRFALSEEVALIQDDIISALVATHVPKVLELADVAFVSVDNPNPDMVDGLPSDLRAMFGVKLNDGVVAEEGVLGGMNIVLALHCCGLYEMLSVMRMGAFGLVHGDFIGNKMSSLLRGDSQLLADYLNQNKMIGVGFIPQNELAVEQLATECGISVPLKLRKEEKNRYLVDNLLEDEQKVVAHVVSRFDAVVDYCKSLIGDRLSLDEVKSGCVPSYLCGFGSTKSPVVAAYALDLGAKVANKIQGITT